MAKVVSTVSGGDKWEAYVLGMTKPVTIDVGFMGDATDDRGTPVAQIAAWNEYGGANRVPRPFMQETFNEHSDEWGPLMATELRHGADTTQAANIVGTEVKNEIEDAIREFTDPELRPYTIAKKGFDKPLIDTGRMLNSVTFNVEDA